MAERFSRLFLLDEETYASGSPVLIAAGALLKDSVTDSIVAQLKFQNLSNQSVIAVKIKLRAYDVAGNEIPGVDDYQYLDLNVRTGECWGADKAIILPEAGTRSFSVEQIGILFSGKSTWEITDFTDSISLPKGVSLERELTEPELVSQYRIAVNQCAKYVPTMYGQVWRCSCGAINRNDLCHSCHAAKSLVFSEFDVSTLSEKVKERLAQQQSEEAEKKKQRQKQARTFKKLAATGIPVILLGLIFALWIVPYVIEPNSRYSNACALVEAGQFDEAIEAFESLGDYRDAPVQIKATQYAKADALAEAGRTDEAEELFKALGDYEDSPDRVNAIRYARALSLADEGDYVKAIEEFEALGDYKDAEEQVTALQNGTFSTFAEDIQSGNYEEAYSIMTASSKVWTSKMLEQADAIAMAQYDDLLATGRAEDATRLSETFQLAPERTYNAAIELIQAGDYDDAYGLLVGVSAYKNAEKLMTAIDNRIDGVYSHGESYMSVTTSFSVETGEYRYRASRWYYGQFSQFSQGNLLQVKASDIEGDLIFEYAADYFRWTVSADKTRIVIEEIAGDYSTNKGDVVETTTWTLLDDEAAANALRKAQNIGIA